MERPTLAPANASIRVVTIDGNPWFVAIDVLAVLGMDANQSANYLRALADDEKSKIARSSITLGNVGRGAPYLSIISESGLYKLIMRSDKPEARAFQDWVTRVVLPSIRKDGMYVLDNR